MVFPNIFFHQRFDGSIVGCIPSALWSTTNITKHFGFVSIEDHMRNRIMNSSLHCSTEPAYLFFAFDTICNAKSGAIHSQIILNRGFEHMLGAIGIYGFREENVFSSMETVYSQKTVLQLAAFLREIILRISILTHVTLENILVWLLYNCGWIRKWSSFVLV